MAEVAGVVDGVDFETLGKTEVGEVVGEHANAFDEFCVRCGILAGEGGDGLVEEERAGCKVAVVKCAADGGGGGFSKREQDFMGEL